MIECNKVFKRGVSGSFMDFNIVSLHGYNTSHETGFERAVYDAFSGDCSFVRLDLLGHGAGRDAPDFCSLGDVISDGVKKISDSVDGRSVLMGFSFGAYPLLEYMERGGDALGVVVVKPMVDLRYTFSRCPEMEHLRGVLKPDDAVSVYSSGSVYSPFELCVPSLVFACNDDEVVGGLDFQRERVGGGDLSYIALAGGHFEKCEEDLARVVSSVGEFLERLII